MRSIAISDEKDTLIGLRLAGIEGVLIHSQEEADELFDRYSKDESIGILILTENVFDMVREKAFRHMESKATQLITMVPNSGGLKDTNFLMRQIKESVGIKI